MTDLDFSKLNALTTSEIMQGVILYTSLSRFSDTRVFMFFDYLGSQDSVGDKRFSSKSIGHMLSFFEMGHILYSVVGEEQFYRMREEMRPSIRSLLKDEAVLPAHEHLLQELAEKFDSLTD